MTFWNNNSFETLDYVSIFKNEISKLNKTNNLLYKNKLYNILLNFKYNDKCLTDNIKKLFIYIFKTINYIIDLSNQIYLNTDITLKCIYYYLYFVFNFSEIFIKNDSNTYKFVNKNNIFDNNKFICCIIDNLNILDKEYINNKYIAYSMIILTLKFFNNSNDYKFINTYNSQKYNNNISNNIEHKNLNLSSSNFNINTNIISFNHKYLMPYNINKLNLYKKFIFLLEINCKNNNYIDYNKFYKFEIVFLNIINYNLLFFNITEILYLFNSTLKKYKLNINIEKYNTSQLKYLRIIYNILINYDSCNLSLRLFNLLSNIIDFIIYFVFSINTNNITSLDNTYNFLNILSIYFKTYIIESGDNVLFSKLKHILKLTNVSYYSNSMKNILTNLELLINNKLNLLTTYKALQNYSNNMNSKNKLFPLINSNLKKIKIVNKDYALKNNDIFSVSDIDNNLQILNNIKIKLNTIHLNNINKCNYISIKTKLINKTNYGLFSDVSYNSDINIKDCKESNKNKFKTKQNIININHITGLKPINTRFLNLIKHKSKEFCFEKKIINNSIDINDNNKINNCKYDKTACLNNFTKHIHNNNIKKFNFYNNFKFSNTKNLYDNHYINNTDTCCRLNNSIYINKYKQ